ncbi:MAG: T9SS type A sorting domain-containing protein [Ferruginibacter sp.]
MKKYLFTLLTIGMTGLSNLLLAQILSVGASGVTLKAGTIFYADGLILTPSADITLANLSLSRNATVSHPTSNPYISRVYRFSANTAPFSGTVQINYIDPGELNGIPEANLLLNVHNGALWQAFPGTVNTINNYVLSNPLTNVALNELTLANQLTPLPLTWLSFTAIKQNSTVLLKWSTGNEQNTKDFVVQYSIDGIRWNNLTTILRGVASSNTQNYSYVHTSPVKGINVYRILQNDLDGRKSYSELRTVKFIGDNATFTVLVNPVSNGTLQIQVNSALALSLYTADGKLIWQKTFNAGLQNMDVSIYAKGIYLMKGNDVTIKIVIQ